MASARPQKVRIEAVHFHPDFQSGADHRTARLGSALHLCSKRGMKTRKHFVDPIVAVVFAAFLIAVIAVVVIFAL
jgi:hypothetical protein